VPQHSHPMIEVPANAYPVVEATVDPIEVDAVILRMAAARGMVLTISQLEAAGISRFQVHRRLGRLLTQVTDGVYAVGVVTGEVRLQAALAALPQAFVSHGTAAQRHGLPIPPSDEVSVLLSGRRSFMGYTGRIMSHGLAYADRETDVKNIYAGKPQADELLRRHRIGYVVVGPPERETLSANEEFFMRFPLVGEAGGYRLYAVPGS